MLQFVSDLLNKTEVIRQPVTKSMSSSAAVRTDYVTLKAADHSWSIDINTDTDISACITKASPDWKTLKKTPEWSWHMAGC